MTDPLHTLAHLAHEAATEPDRVKRREVLTAAAPLVDAVAGTRPKAAHKPRA